MVLINAAVLPPAEDFTRDVIRRAWEVITHG